MLLAWQTCRRLNIDIIVTNIASQIDLSRRRLLSCRVSMTAVAVIVAHYDRSRPSVIATIIMTSTHELNESRTQGHVWGGIMCRGIDLECISPVKLLRCFIS